MSLLYRVDYRSRRVVMGYNRVLHTSCDTLVPVEEARAIVSVPDASLLEAAAVLEEERTTLKFAQKHDTARRHSSCLGVAGRPCSC